MPEICPATERYEAERQEAAQAALEWRNGVETEYVPHYDRPQEFVTGAQVLTDDEPPLTGVVVWYGIDQCTMGWRYWFRSPDGTLYSYPPGCLMLA